MRLWLASQSANPLRVVKVVDDISSDAGLNTRVLHLEGEKVFGSTKHKLDLPQGDESDSHRHRRVTYNVSKLSKRASYNEFLTTLLLPTIAQHGGLAQASTSQIGVVQTKIGLLIFEYPCTNFMSCNIEHISPSSLDLYRAHSTNET